LLREALLEGFASQETAGWISSQKSIDQQFAAAFRRWGVDVDRTDEATVVARLRDEPKLVQQEVIAALDAWLRDRRQEDFPEAVWRRLFRVAERLDRNEQRRQLRELLVREAPPRAECVAALLIVRPS